MREYEVTAYLGVKILASNLRATSLEDARVIIETARKQILDLLNDSWDPQAPYMIKYFDFEEVSGLFDDEIEVVPCDGQECGCTCHEED